MNVRFQYLLSKIKGVTMTISHKIEAIMTKSSWIRKMFEEGAKLKANHGNDNVFDFSLGNPNLPPPDAFQSTLLSIIENMEIGGHGYMPNAGFPFVRKAVAKFLSEEHQQDITENEVLMTCGAAGAINVTLKAILNPGEELIVPAPFFVEYGFYADNHGGELKTVPTLPDFNLDLDAMEAAITEKTRAVLVNFPNNPTGQVYSEESLRALGALLKKKGEALGKTIYLLSDEPYRKIAFDDIKVPSVFDVYSESIILNSYSKDMSLPGERIGYIAIHPKATHKVQLAEGMTLANRILGFVSAPGLIQRVVGALQGVTVDMEAYNRKRNLLRDGLKKAGYEFVTPSGAFYFFPKSPIPDDIEFVKALQEERILAVPGTGFGGPGHFRIAFCVADDTIVNALPGFERVISKFK
jgi:aspartate aminotransferase